MDSIGLDLGKCQSQIAILREGGELVERRIATEHKRLQALFGRQPRSRVLIEASTESEWVARCLEELGHEVIVADPNYAPMYGMRNRRVKTDRRDALALAEACRLGAYRPVHRVSHAQRHVRAQLTVREALVRTRSRYICVVRALLRREGLRVRSGQVASFLTRLAEVDLSQGLQEEIAPLRQMLLHLNEQIEQANATVARIAGDDPRAQLLCSVPGVGAVTATAFVATLDRTERFQGAHQVEAYLGLVPAEYSSGECRHRGRITKTGNRRMRSLLVETAWRVLISKRPETEALRSWALRIAARRGRGVAAVALARRLAGILFAMLRDAAPYRPRHLAAAQEHAA